MTVSKASWYEPLIFMTGAVVLSLEVLASRIMTPYFGVSLYIWAGILSITLTFLAIGYALGGRLARRHRGDTLELLFLSAPVASATSVILACAVYPVLFPVLPEIDLVLGSFVAASVLLALPLMALSAMNPMLIALLRNERPGGDTGAGRVFFISTAGSVAGVLVTAFVFIPNITNYRALLFLSLASCIAVAPLSLKSMVLSASIKRRFLAGCLSVASLSVLLLLGQERYLDMTTGDSQHPYRAILRAEYTSIFGNVKVVEIRPLHEAGTAIFAYVQDGLIQNRATLDGVSVSLYTHVLDTLAHAFMPNAERALILGLGAGIVPRDFESDGLDVSVVEINADALEAASTFFKFVPNNIAMYWQDARTFVRRCRNAYDIVVLDLYQGDGTPDYLLTAEFFGDLRRCMRTGGALVMNAFLDPLNEEPNRYLFATLASAFQTIYKFRSPVGNDFLVATAAPVTVKLESITVKAPAVMLESIRQTLASGRQVNDEELIPYEAVSDRQNIFSVLYADAEMIFRRSLVRQWPPRVLVN